MQRLNVVGPNRYYVCRACSTVREDVCRADGTILETHFHKAQSDNLPPVVIEQARDILEQPRYEQPSLF